MHRIRFAAWLACLLPVAACEATKVAVVDDRFGFEQVAQDHTLHLQSMRTRLHADRAPTGALDRADQASERYRFFLDFHLENRHASEVWIVTAKEFEVELLPCADGLCPDGVVARLDAGADQLVAVPARSHVELSLPVVIELPLAERVALLERFRLELRYRAGNQQLLLVKRMAVGSFDQIGQAIRVVGIFTGALLLVAAL
ncbi:MAG: hypothetical protein U1E76_09365 [Planctomycetota bacterium]